MMKIFAFIMIFIFIINVFPALLSHDQVKIQQACDHTSEQIIKFTTDRIVEEAETMPFEVVVNGLSK